MFRLRRVLKSEIRNKGGGDYGGGGRGEEPPYFGLAPLAGSAQTQFSHSLVPAQSTSPTHWFRPDWKKFRLRRKFSARLKFSHSLVPGQPKFPIHWFRPNPNLPLTGSGRFLPTPPTTVIPAPLICYWRVTLAVCPEKGP